MVWLKGFGNQSAPTYEHVEIWASAYSGGGASQLTPAKVTAFPWKAGSTSARAAFDSYAAGRITLSPDIRSVDVWHIPDGERRVLTLGTQFQIVEVAGVLSDEIVFPVYKKNGSEPFTIYRVKTSSIPVAPPLRRVPSSGARIPAGAGTGRIIARSSVAMVVVLSFSK